MLHRGRSEELRGDLVLLPLLSVRDALDPEVSSDPLAYPDEAIMAQCESYAGLPQEILDLYDSEWTRLKSASVS